MVRIKLRVTPGLDGLLPGLLIALVGGMIFLFLFFVLFIIRIGAALLLGLLFRFFLLLFFLLPLLLLLLLLPPTLLFIQAFLLDLVGSLFDPFFNVRVPPVTGRASVVIFGVADRKQAYPS